jgi:DNA-binding HxlR family transcriptional regulator
MKPNVYDPNCPTRAVLDRIGDKWTALVVLALLDGPLRFSQLRDRIGGVAPKVLTETLRRLERDGILTRTAYPEIPPHVEYRLTPLGRSLAQPMRAVTEWAEHNIARIMRARDRYDARAAQPRTTRPRSPADLDEIAT